VAPVAAGPHHVDGPPGELRRQGDQVGRGEHGVEHPVQLIDRLALHAQGHDEGTELGRAGVTGQDLVHGRTGGVGGQVLVRDEVAEDRGPAPEVRQRSHGGRLRQSAGAGG
jgi:hypothetical protein